MAHPHRKSDIWNHFSDVGCPPWTAKCSYCSQIYSFKNGNNGNLIRHIRLKHKEHSSGIHIHPKKEKQSLDRKFTVSAGKTLAMGKKSSIWNHYSKVGSKIVCGHCSATISSTGGSTSNLLRHLRLKHKDTPFPHEDLSSLENAYLETAASNTIACTSRRKSSGIWKHFSCIGNVKAVCNYCSNSLSIKGGNVGNLSRHMKHVHRGINIYDNIPFKTPGNTQDLDELILETNVTEMSPTQFEAMGNHSTSNEFITDNISNDCKPSGINFTEQIDQQLVKMLAKGYHPFSFTQGEGFKQFINVLCPDYKLPTTEIISNDILKQMFNSTEELVRNKISDSVSVCVTLDNWTSVKDESFVTTTAYWINSKTELCSGLLDCIALNNYDLVKPLDKALQESFEKWEIAHKIIAIVSSNASNIAWAIKKGGWPHLVCFAHSLNVIVQRGLVAINNLIIKIRKLITFFNSNTCAQADLVLAQENMGLQVIELKKDIPSHWNTTYKMLKRVLNVKDEIIWVLGNIENDECIELTTDEWEIADLAMKVLTIFNEIALELKGEKNVPLSKQILFIQGMKRYIQRYLERESLPQPIQLMIDILLNEIEEKFGHCEANELIAESTLLDPRFKKVGCEIEEKYNTLRAKVSAVKVETVPNDSQNDNPVCTATSYLWKEFDEKINEHFEQSDTIQESNVELDKYMNEPLISRMSDPLIWWEQRKMIYPRLYSIACKRLCIVATCVPGETFYCSKGRNIIENRNRLTSSKINEIAFLHSNAE